MGNCGNVNNDFDSARSEYNRVKNFERLKIVYALQDAGYEASGRQGLSRYTSRGRMEEPADLSSCKWVYAQKNDFTVIIDLQTVEVDPVTGSTHVLDGVISIDVLPSASIEDGSWEQDDRYVQSLKLRYGVERPCDEPAFSEMLTDFRLPLSDDDRCQLLIEIDHRINLQRS